MRTWLGLAMTAVLVGVSVCACSSTPADKYPGSDSMCAEVAKQECKIASICAVPNDVCVQARTSFCQTNLVGPAVSTGRTYTPALAEDCVSKTSTLYGTDRRAIPVADIATRDDACNRVFQGTAKSGGQCKSSYDCSGTTAVCTNGFCGDKTVRAKGAGCANPGDVCDTGLYCAPGTPALCQPGKSGGDACAATSDCTTNLRCSNKVCAARLPAGGTCDSNDDCDATAAYCDRDSGKICTQGLIFGPKLATCKPYGGT